MANYKFEQLTVKLSIGTVQTQRKTVKNRNSYLDYPLKGKNKKTDYRVVA